jgi:hypothetical protein
MTPPHSTNQLLRNLKERQPRQIFHKKTRKRKKTNDMVIGTWNVMCLNQAGSLKNLKDEVKHKTALQEIRLQGGGMTDT